MDCTKGLGNVHFYEAWQQVGAEQLWFGCVRCLLNAVLSDVLLQLTTTKIVNKGRLKKSDKCHTGL